MHTHPESIQQLQSLFSTSRRAGSEGLRKRGGDEMFMVSCGQLVVWDVWVKDIPKNPDHQNQTAKNTISLYILVFFLASTKNLFNPW